MSRPKTEAIPPSLGLRVAGNKKRAAIYARYSTEGQKDISIDDQYAYCEAHADKLGGIEIVARYADRAKSGLGILKRPEVNKMIEDAEQGKFDMIIVESLDRLARHPADMQPLYRDLNFAGVALQAVNDGECSAMLVMMRGMISLLESKNTSARVHRHHSGRARDGKILGVVSYGYRALPRKSEGDAVDHEINPEQAKIVRHIFKQYAAGETPRMIVAALNEENLASPGSHRKKGASEVWRHQTITKMLVNRLYIGEVVWNRCQAVLNPHTENKISRDRPEAEWIVAQTPHLRIIPQDLWNAVQKVRTSRAQAAGNVGQNKGRIIPRKNGLLAGLLRCSECGSDMHIMCGGTRRRISCSAAAKGDEFCQHHRSYELDKIEQKTIEYCRDVFSQPEVINAHLRDFEKEYVADQRRAKNEVAATDKRRGEVEAGIRKYFNLLESGGMPEDMVRARLQELEAERVALERRRQTAENKVEKITVLPSAVKLWHAALAKLAADIKSAPPELRQMARTLLVEVRVYPTAKKQPYKLHALTRREALAAASKAAFPEVKSVARRGVIVNFDNVHNQTSYGSISKNDNSVISLGIFTTAA